MKNGNYNLGDIESGPSGGLDAFFAAEPQIVTPTGQGNPTQRQARIRVGSLQQLNGFQRLSADTLVHKSTNDLWALRKEGESFFIERLFQDDGKPLKG